MLAHEPYSHKCADEPKNGRQEREGDVGLPLLTSAILCDVAPVEDVAAVKRADELFPKLAMRVYTGVLCTHVDQQTEGGNPETEENDVDRPVNECPTERQKPKQREEYG
jgi:hypothetical protein